MIRTAIAASALLLGLIGTPSLGAGSRSGNHGAAQDAEQGAGQDSESGQGAGSASAPAGERKICKTFANSASRMKSERLCLTQAGWKKFDALQE